MKRNSLILICAVLLGATALFFTSRTKAQSSNAERRITQAVDETQLVRLTGNTHPSARPEFDQGAAPPDLPMQNMMLILKPSPEQAAALSTLLRQQQDRSSPNYHKWLTPDEFGQQFGASQSDIDTVSSWLQSHSFSIELVARGRTMIQFSGIAQNVSDAFHTQIHKYLVKGEEHWANNSDPYIPAALTPVVVGPNSLHSFHPKAANRHMGTFARNKTTGQVRPINPKFTFGTGCGLQNILQTTPCFLIGPGDFAKIYDVPTATTGGTGITIGIVGDSEIQISDTTTFYSIFGISRSAPTQFTPPTGTNPGVQPCPGGDECEADIDTQWAGSVAPGAAIELVNAANTNTQNGVDVAAQYIVNQGGAQFQVLSESFGNCEFNLEQAENEMFGGANGDSGLWSQAAAEGITVLVSSGDLGSTGCDSPDTSVTIPQPATHGLAVNGIASTWDNVSVGGTDFNQFSDAGTFWNTTQNTLTSAKSYIPETTWNDSCSNVIFTMSQLGFFSTAQVNCNAAIVTPSFIIPAGGGGGASNCVFMSGANCSGGYPKPTYQTALTPSDAVRDLPDVSFFAGTGLLASFYAVCDQDLNSPPVACSTASVSDIQGFGGTSVGTAAFAGIVALIDHVKGGPLGPAGRTGRINDRLYTLAATGSCTSAAPTPPATNPPANCVFNDVVMGTNAQPCKLNTPNCSSTSEAITIPPTRIFSTPTTIFIVLACVSFIAVLTLGFRLKERNWSTAFAVLLFAAFIACAACGSGGGNGTGTGPATCEAGATCGITTGFSAAAGYDQATGLGSVNVTALISAW
ncbi:MAG: protease pro-enzyme activation domain-containing protein [Candidatus Acidiferrales bacterium]